MPSRRVSDVVGSRGRDYYDDHVGHQVVRLFGKLYGYRGLQFDGSFDSDLTGTLEHFEAASASGGYGLSTHKRAEAITFMLKEEGLTFYNKHLAGSDTYDEMVGLLKGHFQSEDQQYRMLYEWQSCSSSSMLEKHPGKSQKNVFEKMLNRLRACQGQMNSVYHHDRILRDQLMIAIEMPGINRSLRERMPLISEDLI